MPEQNSTFDADAYIEQRSETLREAERALKADGVPVFSDLRRGGLWVFHIYGIVGAQCPGISTGVDTSGKGKMAATVEQERDDRWLQLEERLKEEWDLQGESFVWLRKLMQLTGDIRRVFRWCLPCIVAHASLLGSRCQGGRQHPFRPR